MGKFGGLVVPQKKNAVASDTLETESPTPDVDVQKLYPDLKYTVPFWGSNQLERFQYFFEIIKGGEHIGNVELDDPESLLQEKGWMLVGRLPPEDAIPHFTLMHPSVSRQHAVLQMKANGQMFLFDLGSTHGTFLNKRKVRPKAYIPLRCGDLLRFGQSSRLYHFTSHSDTVLENPNLPPEALQAQVEGNSEVFAGSYHEMKEFMKKNAGPEKKAKKKGNTEDDEEEEAEALGSDGEAVGAMDDKYFLGADGGEEDNFYDDTKKTQKKFDRTKLITPKSLQRSLIQIQGEIDALESQIAQLSQTGTTKSQEAGDDALDSFMSDFLAADAAKNVTKLQKELKMKLGEKQQMEKQLDFLTPSLDRIAPLKRERDQLFQEEEVAKKPRTLPTLSPPPSPPPQESKEQDAVPASHETTNPSNNTTQESASPVPKPTVSQPNSRPNEVSKPSSARKNKKEKKKQKSQPTLDSADPSQYIEWVPPKGQKGDGTTHLNSKYGY